MRRTPGNQEIRKFQLQAATRYAEATGPAYLFQEFIRLNVLVGLIRTMAGVSFSWMVIQGYILLLTGMVEVFLEPAIKARRAIQSGLITALLVGGVWFTRVYVLAVVPLSIGVLVPGTNYDAGAVIAGIQWHRWWTDLRY